MIGVWTAISWMHKQIYIFKKAQKLKTTAKENGTKINLDGKKLLKFSKK